MPIELSDVLKTTYQDAAKNLKGSARRKFMAGIVESLGRGGQSYCERELGWDSKTMRKGSRELESGVDFADRPSNPGRKRTEERLPRLIEDLERILDGESQNWNGSLLDSIETVLSFARTFTWRSQQPAVTYINRIYKTGVKLSQKAMAQLEQRFQRLSGLEKWFATISPIPS